MALLVQPPPKPYLQLQPQPQHSTIITSLMHTFQPQVRIINYQYRINLLLQYHYGKDYCTLQSSPQQYGPFHPHKKKAQSNLSKRTRPRPII